MTTTPSERAAAERDAQGLPPHVTDEAVLRRTAAAIRHSTAATKASTGAVVGPAGSTVRPLSGPTSPDASTPSNAASEHGVAPADPSSESETPRATTRSAS